MSELAKAFLDQGGFAVTALVALAGLWKVYRDAASDRASHRIEMTAFQERYVTKADKWIEKHQEQNQELRRLLEAISLRIK